MISNISYKGSLGTVAGVTISLYSFRPGKLQLSTCWNLLMKSCGKIFIITSVPILPFDHQEDSINGQNGIVGCLKEFH